MRRAAVDVLCWVTALILATVFRYDLSVSAVAWSRLGALIPVVVGSLIASGILFGLYRGHWRYGSFDEVAALAKATTVTTAVVFAADLATKSRPVPRSATLAGGFIALVTMSAVRYAWRLIHERNLRPDQGGTRVLIFGAGEAGTQVVNAMMRDRNGAYYPVGLLDDDPGKRKLSIQGVKVVGDRSAISSAAKELRAAGLILAVPSAGADLVNDITKGTEDAGLRLKVLPPVSELYGTGIELTDIRDLEPADLLGRRPIELDLESIAKYLTNKRVLVTGAGGSIGSELCRQIYRYGPAALTMLDRDENALHSVQLSIEGRAMLDSPSIVLCDIRDPDAVDAVFAEHQPQVVFHAAALKHLTLLERFPGEAVKTNIRGTLNVLEAAVATGVERFVNISTDKAVDPTSVLGYTKRICERLTAEVAQRSGETFLSVRFGNVLGSSGSVLTTFLHQIEEGGPVTVTMPNVTRYFMTIPEAVQLTVQAAAFGQPGEVLVLDMGKPVSINELAIRLIRQAPRPISISYTGLRPGEKVEEVLIGRGESDRRPVHPLVSHVAVPPLDLARVASLAPEEDVKQLTLSLQRMCLEDVGLHEPGTSS